MYRLNFNRFILVGIMLFISSTCFCQDVNNLKLKDYRPVSIYKNPVTVINKGNTLAYQLITLFAH